MDSNRIIDTEFQEVEQTKYFTIEDIARKLNINTTKVNHLIFKLNNASDNFFEDTNKLSETDFEKIQLAFELINDSMTYEDVINYLKDTTKGLTNNKGDSRELTKLDSQVIAKNITLEVKNQVDRVLDEIRNEVSVDIINSFNLEAKKIAQVSLEAIEKTKDLMLDGVNLLNDKIDKLEQQNEKYRKEIERYNSKEIINMRKKIEEKERLIEKQRQEIENNKNKSVFFKLFSKNK